MQEMVIYGVSFDMVGKQPIVLLKAVDSNKFLPIWIGHPEAAAILMKLQGATTPRPMTHDLLVDVLGELDVEVHAGLRHRAARQHLLRVDHADGQRHGDRDRLAALATRSRSPSAPARRSSPPRTSSPSRRSSSSTRSRTPRRSSTASRSSSTRSRRRTSPAARDSVGARRPGASEQDALDELVEADVRRRSAAWGSRLVSVIPGIALASSTHGVPVVVEHQVDARDSRCSPSSS